MSRPALPRLVPLALVALVALAGPAPAVSAAEPGDPAAVSARAYEVRYRDLSDTAELVEELLSADGTLTLKPRLKTLVVEDRVTVLDRVGSLLASFDLPPRSVEVTVNLFLGRREGSTGGSRRGSAALSQEVRGVIETLGDFTKWTSYEPLGSGSVVGVEGAPLSTSLTDEYLVSFTVESVHDSGVVKFSRFSLQRIEKRDDGTERKVDLYTAGMVVDAGDLTLLVAASGPDADRALFLALQAEPR